MGYHDSAPIEPARPGRVAGCLAWLITLVASVVVLCGVGRPNGYRYRIGSMQVFEGPEGVTAFVETDLVTYRPGLIRSPAIVTEPIHLDRIDVSREGTVRRIALKPPAGKSYRLYIDPIIKFGDDLYLLETPGLGHPSPQLHLIRGHRIEPVPVEGSGRILRSMGYTGGSDRETDRITEAFGWRLLDRSRLTLRLPREQVISHRHHLRLRFVVDDVAESLVAESLGDEAHWSVHLLTVSARYWQSYGSPPRPE
jgi:hypothetical protein